jgi:hypothetical protein
VGKVDGRLSYFLLSYCCDEVKLRFRNWRLVRLRLRLGMIKIEFAVSMGLINRCARG